MRRGVAGPIAVMAITLPPLAAIAEQASPPRASGTKSGGKGSTEASRQRQDDQ